MLLVYVWIGSFIHDYFNTSMCAMDMCREGGCFIFSVRSPILKEID